MTDNVDKTKKLLEQLLQKSDAVNEKVRRIKYNLITQVRDIKANLKLISQVTKQTRH